MQHSNPGPRTMPSGSRIPQPKQPSSHSATIQDVEYIRASFAKLNAPSLDDLSRVCHGPLGEALQFAAEHIQGRNRVALVRAHIHRLDNPTGKGGAEHITLKLKAPNGSGSERSDLDRSVSRLSAAKKSVETYQKQLEERQMALLSSQAEVERLQHRLDEKRRLRNLLSLLEVKEGVRVQRVAEVGKLLTGIRISAAPPNNVPLDAVAPTVARPPLKNSYTRDALSALHTHHLRLARLISPPTQPASNAESSLRLRISGCMNADEGDERVNKLMRRFLLLARSKARQKVHFQSPTSFPGLSKEELNLMEERNVKREQELQTVSDLSIGMGYLCNHFVNQITTFLQSTAKVLRSSVEDEVQQARGYVDVLSSHIANSSSKGGDDGMFMREICDICGIKGNAAVGMVLSHVENTVRLAHLRESFLRNADLVSRGFSSEQQKLIDEYWTNERQRQENVIKLLTRKVHKLKVGSALVRDVENMIKEARTLTGIDG